MNLEELYSTEFNRIKWLTIKQCIYIAVVSFYHIHMTTVPILNKGQTGGRYCEFCKYPSN